MRTLELRLSNDAGQYVWRTFTEAEVKSFAYPAEALEDEVTNLFARLDEMEGQGVEKKGVDNTLNTA